LEHKHDAAAQVLVQPSIAAGMDIDGQNMDGSTVLLRASNGGLTSTVATLGPSALVSRSLTSADALRWMLQATRHV